MAVNAKQARRWNGASGQYWIAHRERHLKEQEHLTPHLFRVARITSGEVVLDIGCGCGDTTLAAARAAFNAVIVDQDGRLPPSNKLGPVGGAIGLDLSGPMLNVARRLAMQANVRNATFVQGDAQSCPLRRGSCDVVISNFGVMFFDDPFEAFISITSTVRRGGRLAFLCWQHDVHNELFAIPLRAFAAYDIGPAQAVGDLFVDPRQIKRLLSSTGWLDIQIIDITEPTCIGPDVDDVMSYVRGMPMIVDLAATVGDRTLPERALSTIAEEYAARQDANGVWVRAAAWLVTARLA